MPTYPLLKLSSDEGEIELLFLPDNKIRVTRLAGQKTVCFDLKLSQKRYIYDQSIASYFLNCESDKFDLILAFEQIINNWVDNHPVDKLQFDCAVIRAQIEASKDKIQGWQKHLHQMEIETSKLVVGETENIKEYESLLRQTEGKVLEAKRNSLQRE